MKKVLILGTMAVLALILGCSSAPKRASGKHALNMTRQLASTDETEKVAPATDPYYLGMSLVSSFQDLQDQQLGLSLTVVSVMNGPEVNPTNFVVSLPNGEGDRGADSYYIETYLYWVRDVKIDNGALVITGNRKDFTSDGNEKNVGVTIRVTYVDKAGKQLKEVLVNRTVEKPFELKVPSIPSALKCFGTEPFWGLKISPKGINLSTDVMGKPAGTPFPAAQAQTPAGSSQGNIMVYKTKDAKGKTLEVVVTRESNACYDGMSDQEYEFSVVAIGAKGVLAGCCEIAK